MQMWSAHVICTMETLERALTDPLLIDSKTAVKSAKVDKLRECCESLGLVVGCTGRRQKRVKHDYVTAILTYVSNNSMLREV